MIEKTYFKVELKGEVTIQASDEGDAITKATNFFVTTGQGLAWAVSQVKVQIEPPS